MVSRNCPVCDSARKRFVKKQSTYILARCLQCGFVYVHNPREITISGNEVPPPETIQKRRHPQIKQLLDHYFGKQTSITVVEIGAGFGNLAQIISEDARYCYAGYEPNRIRAGYCKQRGLNVENEYFRPLAKEKVDCIIVDNVLEHVLQPLVLLKDISQSLKHRGVAVIIVPNLYDIRRFARNWRQRHLWQPHCHVNYFSYRHIKECCRRVGLRYFDFGICSLHVAADWMLLPKIVLDHLGIHIAGLYGYAVKIENAYNGVSQES